MKYLLKIRGVASLFLLMALTLSCAKDSYFDIDSSSKEGTPYNQSTKGRVSPIINRNVMIMISGGRNSLSGHLTQDLSELENSDLPLGNYASGNVLVVLSRKGENKSSPAPSSLYRVYRDRNGNVIRDTLRTWGDFTPIFGESTLAQALKLVTDQYPGSNYGIVLSSHASGYLPKGYFNNPSQFETSSPGSGFEVMSTNSARRVVEEFEPIPDYPAVKSIGQDLDNSVSEEMELQAFHDAIPCHMDYILFDACHMGCVEVAYQLRDKASIIGFSPTEILADGFDYKRIASRLVSENPDPIQVCMDYFDQYKAIPKGLESRSATISAIDTRYMDDLAEVCHTLFEKYRSEISLVDANLVQRYFRYGRHFFYDMRDILVKSGVSETDLSALDAILDKAVIYKDHTEEFLGITIDDQSYSGLAMFLPNKGGEYLKNFYTKNISWNQATALVK